MASNQNNNETVHLVKFRTGKIDAFKDETAVPAPDAGTLYFAHSDLNIAESDNEEGEGRPYKNTPYGYIVYDVPNTEAASGVTRVVMGDHARITTYLENPIWLHVGGSDSITLEGHDTGSGVSVCLQGRASDKDEDLADVLGSKDKPFTLSYTDIGADLSSYWTQGQAEGPVLNLSVNGVLHSVAAIPAATGETLTITTTNADGEETTTEYKGISGIVTTGTQSFAGAKTFKAPLTIEASNLELTSASDNPSNNFIIQAEDTSDTGYKYPGLTFGMGKVNDAGVFRLAINEGAPIGSSYHLVLGNECDCSITEFPGQRDISVINLGSLTHGIVTPLSTQERVVLLTDFLSLAGAQLITPFYLQETVDNYCGALLTVGRHGLLTPVTHVGTATQPVYFAEGGIPTACSFQILSGDPIWSSSYKVLGLKQGTSNSDEVRSYAASDCLGCIFIDTTRHIVYISNGLIWEGMNTYQ